MRVSSIRNGQFLLLIVSAMAAAYARGVLGPLQETVRSALALSDNQIALLQGAALALAPVAAAVPLGLLLDRFSRVRILFFVAAGNVIGAVLTALATSFAALFAARCLAGLAHTATCIATFSLLADMYQPEERGRANMMIVIAQFGGVAAAFGLGGVLTALLGSGSNEWRWIVFWLTSPLTFVLLFARKMREPSRTEGATPRPYIGDALGQLWADRTVIGPVIVGCLLAEIAIGAAQVWAAPTLSRNFHLTTDRIGLIMSAIVFLSGTVGSMAGGVLADLCHGNGGPPRTLSVMSGLALSSVPTALFAIVAQVITASVLLVVLITTTCAVIVMALALVTIVVSSERRGLYLSVMVGANTLFGVALAPVMVSLLSGMIGGPATIGWALTLVCTIAGFLSAVSFAVGWRSSLCRGSTDSVFADLCRSTNMKRSQ